MSWLLRKMSEELWELGLMEKKPPVYKHLVDPWIKIMFRNLQDISNHIPKDNLAILKNVRKQLGGGVKR